MREVFADTYYFVALLNDKDSAHSKVVDFSNRYSGQIVTTEWVLVELGDAFCRSHWRPTFLSTLERLHESSQITVVEATHSCFERAVRLFASRPDKNWSLTDCTSFLVMEDRSISEALTADQHFAQAGFAVLLA
jgi:predicted nucleic acid-binding protein